MEYFITVYIYSSRFVKLLYHCVEPLSHAPNCDPTHPLTYAGMWTYPNQGQGHSSDTNGLGASPNPNPNPNPMTASGGQLGSDS